MSWLIKANDPIQDSYSFRGVPIRIEWPKGSIREYKNSDYKVAMKCDYGYIGKTEGNDGEEIDVYVGPNKESNKVFKITQLKKETGKYDEDKFLLGFNTADEATEMYLQHMEPAHFGGIQELGWNTFTSLIKRSLKNETDDSRSQRGDAVHL